MCMYVCTCVVCVLACVFISLLMFLLKNDVYIEVHTHASNYKSIHVQCALYIRVSMITVRRVIHIGNSYIIMYNIIYIYIYIYILYNQ